MTETTYQVTNRNGRPLYATVSMPAEPRRLPLVLLLHGFKGFRNWCFLPVAARHFAGNHRMVVRMDYALNGMAGTDDLVIAPEDFARETISGDADDVHDMLHGIFRGDSPATQTILDRWNGHLHLVGHSRGGGLVHVVGRELVERPIAGVTVGRGAVWNGIGTYVRWTPRQRQQWMDDGFVTVENGRTGQRLRMDSSYVIDIEAHPDRFDLVIAARALAGTVLYCHADQDVTVPVRELRNLTDRAGVSDLVRIIDRTTHTFGMQHPASTANDAFSTVLRHTIEWITAS